MSNCRTITSYLSWGALAALVTLAAYALADARPAQAQTTCTVTSLDNSGDGTLRAHLADGNCDVIDFDSAVLPGTITLETQLTIARDVVIEGPSAEDLSVDGNDGVRVFDIESGNEVFISGITVISGAAPVGGGIRNAGTMHISQSAITGNLGNEEGGGIANSGTLMVVASTISGNSAGEDWGGGISNQSTGTATVINSTISDNSAPHGGGIDNDGTLTVENSTFTENSATEPTFGFGGGIESYGTLTVINSTFTGNSAVDGGGIAIGDGTATVSNSTIAGNTAEYGGGIEVLEGSVTLANSTVSGNSADAEGGGIWTSDVLVVANSTITDNSAGDEGGGIWSGDWETLTADTTVKNSIIAANTGGNCTISGGEFEAVGDNLADDDSCPDFTEVKDVMLDDLDDNGGLTLTHALLEGSPAIDAVTDCTLPDGETPVTTDQRGFLRPAGEACDIGSFEFGATPPPLPLWGDVDCDGTVAIGDALKIARHLLGLSVAQTEPCPEIGSEVIVDGEDRLWGDLDCDDNVVIGDALKTARYLLGLSVSQTEPCPEVGSEVALE